MKYEEIVDIIKKANENADASHIKEHVAIEIDVRGEGEGALYLEIRGGQIFVEPYEYYERDAIVTTSAEMAIAFATGQMKLEYAYNNNLIHFRGMLDKAYLWDEIIRS